MSTLVSLSVMPFTGAMSVSLYMKVKWLCCFNSQITSSKVAFCFLIVTVCAFAPAKVCITKHVSNSNVNFIHLIIFRIFPPEGKTLFHLFFITLFS
ncbi:MULTISPECIES: hypothetical protein [unclassified Butyricimonas]|uniref:hypothetical protein n=1 Tax=unclassified Butyricimonas TaxID=2637652 RepID=UPI0021004ECE|nr:MULTISPECIES: hypothetical protein [unclassified Butyricimonas]